MRLSRATLELRCTLPCTLLVPSFRYLLGTCRSLGCPDAGWMKFPGLLRNPDSCAISNPAPLYTCCRLRSCRFRRGAWIFDIHSVIPYCFSFFFRRLFIQVMRYAQVKIGKPLFLRMQTCSRIVVVHVHARSRA